MLCEVCDEDDSDFDYDDGMIEDREMEN